MPQNESVMEALFALASFLGGGAAALWAIKRSRARLGETLRAATSIVASVIAAPDSYRAMDEMSEQLARLFGADACVVALPTGDGKLFCGPTFGYPDPETLTIREDEGICGYVYMTGDPYLSDDVRKEHRYVQRIPGIRYAIAVPLRYEGKILGVFELESRRRRYRQKDFDVLQPLADQIAAVMANTQLRREAEARAAAETAARKELQAISAIVMAGVASSDDLDAALASMIQEISGRMGWESMAVILYGDDGDLHTRAYYGYPLHSTLVPFKNGEGIVGTVAANGRSVLVNDVQLDPDYLDIVSETRAEMCVPLQVGDRVQGVLNAESPRSNAFSDDDFRLLATLARQMALVIERARIFDLERAAAESLREADRLKDDFVATVSHELRTPLTSIKGYAQTLLARSNDLSVEERETFLQVMVRQSERLAAIVDTLLLVSQLETGDVGDKPVYISAADLLTGATEAALGEARVTLDVPKGLGLVSDPFRIHHILRNVIENACKYSPEGAPVLVRASQREDLVYFEVMDRGPGLPSGQEEEAFQRFQRLTDPGYASTPGTGLGLYIARRFARDLGGDIAVTPGKAPWTGAHFVVTLPVGMAGDREPASPGSAANAH